MRRRPQSDGGGLSTAAAPHAASARRLLALVIPVAAAGAAVAAVAFVDLARSDPGSGRIAAMAGLLAITLVIKAFPVPLEGIGTLSLAAIVVVATSALYGWSTAALLAAVAHVISEMRQPTPLIRVVYSAGMQAMSGALAGLAAGAIGHGSAARVFAQLTVATVAFYLPQLVFVPAAIALSDGRRYGELLVEGARVTAPSFGIMASAALMLDVVWRTSPAYSVALVGPVLATALYQRSVHKTLHAMRLALTDPLTGLGNHRHFHEHLQRELDRAADQATTLSLCLFDLDDFKQINDAHGHPVGDRVLAAIADCLRHGGDAFRLGGDEFALVLPEHDERQAAALADAVLEALAGLVVEPAGAVTFSAGLATYPQHGRERKELLRVADAALYAAKRDGKNRLAVAAAPLLAAS